MKEADGHKVQERQPFHDKRRYFIDSLLSECDTIVEPLPHENLAYWLVLYLSKQVLISV